MGPTSNISISTITVAVIQVPDGFPMTVRLLFALADNVMIIESI